MKARKHINMFAQLKYSGCVNRWHADERFRKTCRSTGNTSEDMQKGGSTCSSSNTIQSVDEGASLNMSHCSVIGTHKPKWTPYHVGDELCARMDAVTFLES